MFRRFLSASILAVFAQSAGAQETYFGAGVAYSSGTSSVPNWFFGIDESDLDAGMLTLILGQRFSAGTGFWGWETSADLSLGAETESNPGGVVCSTVAFGPYLCEHNATIRVVGLYGKPIADGTEVFGTLGLGMLMGDYAIQDYSVEDATTYGVTIGVGLNRDFGNGMTVRGEVIYDSFTNTTQEFWSSDYKGTTLRVALLRKF